VGGQELFLSFLSRCVSSRERSPPPLVKGKKKKEEGCVIYPSSSRVTLVDCCIVLDISKRIGGGCREASERKVKEKMKETSQNF
jgi:hypothetical protein